MKAVIVEIKDGFAAVLSDEGSIRKIKNNNYEIGQVITMKKHKLHITKKLALGIASAAILFLTSGVGVWAYTSPYSYVSLDVNPSIEYTVNRFDLVIDVKAVNNDGEELLGQINLNHLNNKKISDAITATINQIAESGYFDGTAYDPVNVVSGGAITVDDNDSKTDPTTPGGIIITTSSDDEKKSEELAEKLEETVNEAIEETGDEVEVEVVRVGYDRVQRARELGVTPGKLNLVEKLQASAKDPESIDVEEWLDKPVKDIMKAIKANRKGQPLSDEEEKKVIKAVETVLEEVEEIRKVEEKALNNAKKEEEKAKKAQEKAFNNAKKDEEKAKKAEEKALNNTLKELEKAKKAEEKALNNTKKAEEKAKKAEEKALNKDKKEEEKANNKANANKEEKAKNDEAKNNNGNSSNVKIDNYKKENGNSSNKSNNGQSSKGKN